MNILQHFNENFIYYLIGYSYRNVCVVIDLI